MFDKIIDAITPFALGLIVLAGMSLAGWVEFPGKEVLVGIATVFAGILLITADIWRKIRSDKAVK